MDDRLLATHEALLSRFRRSMNLVGPGPLAPHFDDCHRALAGLRPSGIWADLGSGAGFPGVVFAATFPDVAIDLVESRRKRCVFLEHVLAEGLPDGRPAPARVRCARIEDLPDGSYDGALARALAPPPEVIAHARRILRPGGTLLLMLQGDQPHGPTPGFDVDTEHAYEVDGRPRRAVVLRRSADPG